jgi:hypothetical protein
MHQLDGAYKRIERANEHLKDIKVQVAHLIQRAKDKVIFYLDNPLPVNSIKGQTYAYLRRVNLDIPVDEIIKILVGETVYNIRAALDYLVYELPRLDSGNTQYCTQFPIEDSKRYFMKNKDRYLKGINLLHSTSIENFQPYKGCTWSKSIRDLSNPDKHRELVLIKAGAIFETPLESTKMAVSSRNVNVDGNLTFSVAFNDGTSVILILQELIIMVTETLDTFRPEFS